MKLSGRLGMFYFIAFVASIGATLLNLGFFYFAHSVWGWNAKENLELAAAMNVSYTFASLCAHAISAKFGRRKALLGLYVLMTLACIVASFSPTHLAASMCLIMYMFFLGMTWPMVESLCSETTDAHEMSRRVGAYNLTWAVAGAIGLWTAGVLIERWRGGIFLLPAILHGTTVLLILPLALRDDAKPTEPAGHLDPAPALLHSRTLALWLSRIALPAMYVVNFALGAILPTLPIMHQFSPAMQTVCGSVWVVARLIVFAILGATAFWHTRPRLLLLASAGLLAAFLTITLAPSISILIAGQILLGIAMAIVYTGSLYFGMVLSQGSTEHGGYHEALIGLGGVIGPGAGAVTQMLWPGDVRMAIAAVGGIIALSVLGAGGTSLRLRQR